MSKIESQREYDKALEASRKRAAAAVESAVENLTQAVKDAENWRDFAYGPRKCEALEVVAMLKREAKKCGETLVRIKSAMGEQLKLDFHLSMKQEYFAQIWRGEKCEEYRSVTPRYKKFAQWMSDGRPRFVMLYVGMQKTGMRLLIQVKKVEIGRCPLKGWKGKYYILHFSVVQPYLFDDGEYWPFPIAEMPNTKEFSAA